MTPRLRRRLTSSDPPRVRPGSARGLTAVVLCGMAGAAVLLAWVHAGLGLLFHFSGAEFAPGAQPPIPVARDLWPALGWLAASYAVLELVHVLALWLVGDRWQAQFRRSVSRFVVYTALAVVVLAGWRPW